MADIQLFDPFLADAMNGVHDLSSDTLKIALTNVAPVDASQKLSEITQIPAGNGYTTGGDALGGVTSTQTAGVYKLEANNLSFSASGGAISEFRYAVLYNDDTANDNLIGYWDAGSAQNVQNGETFEISFTNRDVFIIQ